VKDLAEIPDNVKNRDRNVRSNGSTSCSKSLTRQPIRLTEEEVATAAAPSRRRPNGETRPAPGECVALNGQLRRH